MVAVCCSVRLVGLQHSLYEHPVRVEISAPSERSVIKWSPHAQIYGHALCPSACFHTENGLKDMCDWPFLAASDIDVNTSVYMPTLVNVIICQWCSDSDLSSKVC